MHICFTVTIFLIMTCYQLHATFFGSKRCPGGNTQAPPQTVQTVHLNEGRTPFCTVSSQKINKQTNTVSRSSSSQTMLEGVCGCFMPCNLFLAGNSEVSLVLHCFTAELITYIVCECDAPECSMRTPALLLRNRSWVWRQWSRHTIPPSSLVEPFYR